MRKAASLLFLAFCLASQFSKAQTWIWFPGDLDIWTGNRVNSLRTENGGMWPAFWRMDSHEQSVMFSKTVELSEGEEVEIAVEGKFSIRIDGHFLFGQPERFTVPAGKHSLGISVVNHLAPPAIWLKGRTIQSDTTWMVGNYAHTLPADTWTEADGRFVFADAGNRPSSYRLPTDSMLPASVRTTSQGDLFATFAREEIGYLQLRDVKGEGQINIYYGESEDEALDKGRSYLCDKVRVATDSITDLATKTSVAHSQFDYTLPSSRAMRYVMVECEGGVSVGGIALMSEMKPLDNVASFECSDTLLNRIWQVGIHTLHLTDREVMIEGIKRDRWMWSGDAIQSYLMNYYAFMDTPVVRRTIWALRGKDPVEQHINTILDYTFFWLISVSDYYLYTADSRFVRQIYPRMRSLMDYVEGRLNADGMVEGRKGDWVFVDWSLHGFPKDGQLSFEQLVYLRSLEAIAECASIAGNKADAERYTRMADRLRQRIIPDFWNDEAHALVHSTKNGQQRKGVTRYANIFAVLYGLLDSDRQQQVLQHVFLNDSVQLITTPYMRFYELEALCALGEHQRVMQEMRDYWGGMLREGATTFWETYDPKEGYPARLAMYGHPYGKSLCHAWGASPVYLLGKYYLGVRPTAPGYAAWEVKPCLGDLKWMRGTVSIPGGSIRVEMTRRQITVRAEGCTAGTLIYQSGGKTCRQPVEAGQTISVKVRQ